MQIKLRDLCNQLTAMGVKWMLSNSDATLVHELYANYKIDKVFASRRINVDATKRGKITEVLIKNY